jgi:hypothetical protein
MAQTLVLEKRLKNLDHMPRTTSSDTTQGSSSLERLPFLMILALPMVLNTCLEVSIDIVRDQHEFVPHGANKVW